MSYCAPNSQPLIYSHMTSLQDLRGCLPNKVLTNSILEVLEKNKDLSFFYDLVLRGKFSENFNSVQSDFTVFVPSNTDILKRYGRNIFENYDIGDAREYLKAAVLNNKIVSELLENGSYLYTIDKITRIRIFRNADRIQLNNGINIIYPDILCVNGVIHIVDDIINGREFTVS